jgi:hypothetical protein
MRHLIIMFASAALLNACQSNDGPTAPEGEPAQAEEQPVIEKASELGPVSGIGGVGKPTSPQDQLESFEESMKGAEPGEVRGFVNPDGDTAYALLANGEISFQEFAEHVFNKKEGLSLSPDELRKTAQQLAEQNEMKIDLDKPIPANTRVVCELKHFQSLVKFKQDGAAVPVSTSKTVTLDGGVSVPTTVTGGSAPRVGGLDID